MNDDEIIRDSKLNIVKNHVPYFSIEKCIEEYRKNEGKTDIIYFLAHKYIIENDIKKENVLEKILPIDKEAYIKEMYEAELNDAKSCYIAYFYKDNQYAGGLIVIHDEQNETFAIYPNEFIINKKYYQIDNIDNLENLVETVKKNGKNDYEYIYLSEKQIIERYIKDFNIKLQNNDEIAYNILSNDCKEEKFDTIQKFKDNKKQIMEQLNDIEIGIYDAEHGKEYIKYIFEDFSNHKYVIYEENVMNYKIYF